jgi:hypothetical protein
VSEWAAQELVVALSISAEAADALLIRSLTLVHRLPGTLAALEAGALHPGHLWPMLDKVAPIEDATVRSEVEAGLLHWAAGRVTTPAQLGAKARREVATHDARAAARRLEKAIRERAVHLRPEITDGMAAVTASFTVPEAQAFYLALGAYADAVVDEPGAAPRTRGQKMADCLLDLVLRPGETDLPPVQVLLTVVASVATLAGGDQPAEIDGHVVPAEMARELLRSLSPASEPGGVPDEAGMPGDTASRPWQQVEQEELESWWAEVEQRVLADPEGGADDGRAAGSLLPLDEEFPEQLADGSFADSEPPESEPPDSEPTTDGVASGGNGWWELADRAVDDASRGVLRAGEAVARARRLVRTAVVADAADESVWQVSPAGRVTAAETSLEALGSAADVQREWLAELLAATGGGGLVERPRIALTDALSGALLALTDLPGLQRAATCGAKACVREPDRCTHDLRDRPGLGPPEPTQGYRPSAPLDRWVRIRDRRCRFPGCRRRVPRGGELDHDRPYPSGPTSADNLTGYCTSHHRGKHQAPAWRHALEPDGTLVVTTPTGLVAVTTPPPF